MQQKKSNVLMTKLMYYQKNQTEWIDGDIGDVFTFRGGKAIQFRTFGDPKEALKFAGVYD